MSRFLHSRSTGQSKPADGLFVRFRWRIQAKFGCEEGSALVEFALVSVLMIIMLTGIVDYGLFILANLQLQEDAVSAAAYGSVPGSQSNSGAMQFFATYNASSYALPLSNFGVTTTNYYSCTPGGATVSATASCSGGTPNEYVKVVTQGTFTNVISWPGIPSQLTLYGTAIYRVRWVSS